MTDNTLENKARFFAMYVLQGLFVNGLGAKGWLTTVDLSSIAHGNIGGHLELTPLSQISNENAIEVVKMAHELSFTFLNPETWIVGRDTEYTDYDFIMVKSKNSHHSFDIDLTDGQITMYQGDHKSENTLNHYGCVDYLRSRGYALPWMGLSVEELVNRGWVKLKGCENDC